jgi:hypothetical protein
MDLQSGLPLHDGVDGAPSGAIVGMDSLEDIENVCCMHNGSRCTAARHVSDVAVYNIVSFCTVHVGPSKCHTSWYGGGSG